MQIYCKMGVSERCCRLIRCGWKQVEVRKNFSHYFFLRRKPKGQEGLSSSSPRAIIKYTCIACTLYIPIYIYSCSTAIPHRRRVCVYTLSYILYIYIDMCIVHCVHPRFHKIPFIGSRKTYYTVVYLAWYVFIFFFVRHSLRKNHPRAHYHRRSSGTSSSADPLPKYI